MAADVSFIRDLAIVTVIAAGTTLVFHRLRLPILFGLLAAGVIIGPHTPPFSLVSDEATLQTLADLGVVLLLFGLGLDFELRALRRLGVVALVTTLVEVLIMFWVGFQLARWLGWSTTDALFLGAMLGISSTAIIVMTLRELGRLREEASQILFAVLVLEDVFAVVILALLGGYAATGGLVLDQALLVAGRMTVFLGVMLLVGLLVLPRFLAAVARRYPASIQVLTLVGVALGAAAVSELAGFHMGLGAFIAGAALASGRNLAGIHEQLRPVHDLFSSIFFVAMGTLLDFHLILEYWFPVVLVCVLLIVGKLVGGALPVLLAGYPPRSAFKVGSALAQIGEFSFVIAALGLSLGVMSPFLFPIILASAAVTSLTSPLFIRFSDPVGRALGQRLPAALRTYAQLYAAWAQSARERAGPAARPAMAAARRSAIVAFILAQIVVGAGFFGQDRVAAFLEGRGIPPKAAILAHWGLMLALLAPLFYEFVRSVHRWVNLAARPGESPRRVRARVVAQYTIYVLASVLVGLPVTVATAPLLDQTSIVLAWLGLIVSAILLLGTQIRRLHGRVEKTLQALLEERGLRHEVPKVLASLYEGGMPLDFTAATTVLQPESWAVGRALSSVGVRESTGASIILVERGSEPPMVPSHDTVFLSGDELTLIGSDDELEACQALLQRSKTSGEVHRDLRGGRVLVAPGSPLAGQSLREAALRVRFGLQVIAILRGGRAVPNPGPDERLRPDDILLVLGPADQVLACSREGVAGAKRDAAAVSAAAQ